VGLSDEGNDGMSDIKQRLLDACNGHPAAKIPWPHRLLHDAHNHIAELEAEVAALKREENVANYRSAISLANSYKAELEKAEAALKDEKEKADKYWGQLGLCEIKRRELEAEVALKQEVLKDCDDYINELTTEIVVLKSPWHNPVMKTAISTSEFERDAAVEKRIAIEHVLKQVVYRAEKAEATIARVKNKVAEWKEESPLHYDLQRCIDDMEDELQAALNQEEQP